MKTINNPIRLLAALFLLAAIAAAPAAAAPAKPVYQWTAGNEAYFTFPANQEVYYPANRKAATAQAWGFGMRTVNTTGGISPTGGVQLQRLAVTDASTGLDGSFYMLDLLLGGEYIGPFENAGPLRFTAGAMADFGLSDNTMYMAPVLTVGLLYQADRTALTAKGFALTLYYRFTDVALDNAAGRAGKVRPVLGLRLGYVFEGFWAPKP